MIEEIYRACSRPGEAAPRARGDTQERPGASILSSVLLRLFRLRQVICCRLPPCSPIGREACLRPTSMRREFSASSLGRVVVGPEVRVAASTDMNVDQVQLSPGLRC